MRCCGRTLMGGVLLLCVLQGAHAADEAAVATLIEQLGDHDFARREAAVQELAKRGADAIDQLVAAAQTESPEVASRVVQLLERLMGSSNVTTVDSADQALVSLTESEEPHAVALATAALGRNAPVREERAVARIRELGGQVQYDFLRDQFGRPQANPFGNPPLVEGNDELAEPMLRPRIVVLKKRWQGGVAGLREIKKLSHIAGLQLYVVNGCGVPLAEAQALASVLPDLVVNERGAYLGVKAKSDSGPCEIEKVPLHGPAAKAGLKSEDIIRSLDEEPIHRFQDLIGMLTNRKEGDQVTIRVARAGRILDINVKLEEWNLPPVADHEAGMAPLPGQQPPPPNVPVPRFQPNPQR